MERFGTVAYRVGDTRKVGEGEEKEKKRKREKEKKSPGRTRVHCSTVR